MNFKKITAGITFGLAALAAQAQPDVNVTIGGVIKPGVYGRVEIGTRPPPPVLYPQPVVILPQPVTVVRQPIYMHVPPGHAKKWNKHCHKYNACNQPVYFVQAGGGDDDDDRDDRKGRGKGKGKGGKHKHDS